jgi:hypothetical protein
VHGYKIKKSWRNKTGTKNTDRNQKDINKRMEEIKKADISPSFAVIMTEMITGYALNAVGQLSDV